MAVKLGVAAVSVQLPAWGCAEHLYGQTRPPYKYTQYYANVNEALSVLSVVAFLYRANGLPFASSCVISFVRYSTVSVLERRVNEELIFFVAELYRRPLQEVRTSHPSCTQT